MQINWSRAGITERQILYRHSHQLIQSLGISFNALFENAFGKEKASRLGRGFERNFWAGTIARARAAQIYEWIRKAHPATAELVFADVSALPGTNSSGREWAAFVEAHAVRGRVSFIEGEGTRVWRRPVPPPTQQTQGQSLTVYVEQPHEIRMQIATPFVVAVDSPIEGDIVGFQNLRGRWVTIPLDLDHGISSIEHRGRTFPVVSSGPRADATTAEPRWQETEPGSQMLVFLVTAKEATPPVISRFLVNQIARAADLNKLASSVASLDKSKWSLLRLDVLFVV